MKNNNTNPIPPDGLSLDIVLAVINSTEDFPIDFDVAWEWLQYSRKDTAKDSLTSCGFVEDSDYKVFRIIPENSKGGRPKEKILLTVECFKMWAMMARTERGREVREYFLKCEKIAKQKGFPDYANSTNPYIRRIWAAGKIKLPHGYWCVFDECNQIFRLITDDRYPVEQFDLVDGSVGKMWSKYRKSEEFDWIRPTLTYVYEFPDKRGKVTPLCYHFDELPYFRFWIQDEYSKNHLPEYLKRKYGAIAKI